MAFIGRRSVLMTTCGSQHQAHINMNDHIAVAYEGNSKNVRTFPSLISISRFVSITLAPFESLIYNLIYEIAHLDTSSASFLNLQKW